MARPAKTKRMIAEETQNKTILDSVKTLKPDDVITEIGNLQVNLQGTLAGLSATITNKIEQMQNIDSAITLKKDELKELYDIEREAMSLEDLRTRIAEERENWTKEIAANNQRYAEEEKEREKKWARVEEQRQYEVNRNHRQRLDELETEFKRIKREEQIRAEDLKRQWTERENVLKNQEEEVMRIKEQAAQFDTKIKDAVAKAEAIATNAVKKHYEHQTELLKKDWDTDKKCFESSVVSFGVRERHLQEEVARLRSELRAAYDDTKEVTSKALESASQRQAAAAFQKAVESGSVPVAKAK